jgi:hypothetical protein
MRRAPVVVQRRLNVSVAPSRPLTALRAKKSEAETEEQKKRCVLLDG